MRAVFVYTWMCVARSERNINRERKHPLAVAVVLDDREAEVEGERGGAEAGDVETQTEADRDAVVVEAHVVGDGT